MPVRAAVACEAGVHEPQAVQQFRAGAEGAADARHARPLVQRQRRRDIQHLFHRGFRSLGHPAAGVGGQRLQIPAGAFGIQHPSASEDLPDPDTPAMPTILFSGMSTSMFFRLCTFAPRTSILSIILFSLSFGFLRQMNSMFSVLV